MDSSPLNKKTGKGGSLSMRSQSTICFFNSNRAWGGGEKWHLSTCLEFQARGFQTFLVTNIHSELFKKGVEKKLDVYSFYIHNLSFLNPFKILSLVALFRSHNVKTVVLNLPSDLKVAGLAAKIAGVKNIIYRRGMPHPLRNTWLNRFLFNNVLSHIVINSLEIGKNLVAGNEDWFPREKLCLIYNGVTTSQLDYDDKDNLSDKKEIIIGNAGRLTSQKGQKYLIELGLLLKEDHIPFKIYIAGTGELENELKKEVIHNDLKEEIIFLGHVEDMPSFFKKIDYFVFTSLYEGSANTLLETLSHKIPTLAFDISSNSEIIIHEKTGLLVQPFNTEVLKNQILRLHNDQDLKKKIILGGMEIIKEKFDSKKNLNILENLILK
jgi:glycosyltransferase involved in cell wall biosynthesis